jgi:hypothetical protein
MKSYRSRVIHWTGKEAPTLYGQYGSLSEADESFRKRTRLSAFNGWRLETEEYYPDFIG